MKKYSVLSFNFGGYDLLREPEEVDPDCEYVYVTDDKNLVSKTWNVVHTDRFSGKSPVYAAFYVRWHPFEFVHTDTCIVLDSSIKILKSLRVLADDVKEHGDIGVILARSSGNKIFSNIGWWQRNRDLVEAEAEAAKSYAQKNLKADRYRGYVEAILRVTFKTKECQEIDTQVWNDCLALGTNGNPIRLDEVPLSAILQTKFRNMRIAKYDRRLIQCQTLMQTYEHKSREMRIHARFVAVRHSYFCNHRVKVRVYDEGKFSSFD